MSKKAALKMVAYKAESRQDSAAGNIENIPLSEDVAARFLVNLDPAIKDQPITPEEARRVLWKIDFIVLPIIAGTVILSAVDKVVISNAAIMGMKDDLNLVGNEYSWAGSIFYFGFLIFEYPQAIFIQRLPVAKLLAACILSWAVLLFCSAATHNFAGLAVVRFIFGCAEAGAFPTASILTVMWYTNREQPVRVAIWYNQFSSVFSGVISYAISQTHTHLAQWRLLLIVLGGLTVMWSAIILAFLPDSPVSAWWLSPRERYIAIRRVQKNNTGIEDKRVKWYQIKELLTDPKTYLLAVFACAQNIPNGGLVTFSSIIVSGLGYSVPITTLLGMPTGVVATTWQIILAVFCAKLKNMRCTIIAVANVIPMVCAILMWQLPRDNQTGLLAAYYVFYTYWGSYVMSTSVPMANVSGHTKKVTMNAVYFFSYCVGNIIGPQVFQKSDAPTYTKGYTGLLISLIVSVVSISAYGLLCKRENAQRDQRHGTIDTSMVAEEEDGALALSDMTDKEKITFRYSY
ncbi:Major facilitator superfamily [Fusarium oxysporum f. sp. vasinfectum]|nr:Major facilitator superfamily [Fusarium oxysporum f. sp. vasinfectum]